MKQYFESTVKSIRIDDDGRERKVTDQVIVEAISFTDAEAKVTELYPNGLIKSVRVSKVIDIIGEGEKYFKAGIELEGEKKFKEIVLFGADDIDQAKVAISEHMALCIVPCELKSIVETKIVEVI